MTHDDRPDRPDHLEPDTLADLQEGLLDADGEAAARRHLESCAACRADLATLTDLPARLAAVADAGPVPDHVARRLDDALAALAASPAVGDEPVAAAAATTVTPLRRPDGPRGMRLLQAAAAVVLVLGLGGIAVSALPRGGDGDAATTGADSGAESAGGAVGGAAGGPAPITASGRDWTPASLAAGSGGLVTGDLGPPVAEYRGEAGARTAPSPGAARDTAGLPAGRLADPVALRICVTRLSDAATEPLAVDLATFEGRPAAVVVLPDPDDPGQLFVYVVEPTCPVGTFLHFTHVPRS